MLQKNVIISLARSPSVECLPQRCRGIMVAVEGWVAVVLLSSRVVIPVTIPLLCESEAQHFTYCIGHPLT